MATSSKMYTLYSTDCGVHKFYKSHIQCTHSVRLPIECINSSTFYILYYICHYTTDPFFDRDPFPAGVPQDKYQTNQAQNGRG